MNAWFIKRWSEVRFEGAQVIFTVVVIGWVVAIRTWALRLFAAQKPLAWRPNSSSGILNC
jgi:hypothetical protein